MISNVSVIFDNINYQPLFSLLIADIYGNAINSLNASSLSSFDIQLTGDIFTSSNPILFLEDTNTIGN